MATTVTDDTAPAQPPGTAQTSGAAQTSGTAAPRRPGYGQLLRTPGAWSFLLPGFAARQPFAMLTIGIVLLVQHTTGSYGTAGAVAAVTGVSMALFAPQSGKLADRLGQAAVLVPGVLVHGASVVLLAALALADAPLWALFAAAVPAGASVPQVGPMVRARWTTALAPASAESAGPDARSGKRSPLLATAAAFESVTDEFTFVVGPVLATALCTSVHPAGGLAAEAVLTVAGGLLFAAQRRTQPPAHRPAHRMAGAGRGGAAAPASAAGSAAGSGADSGAGSAAVGTAGRERPVSALSVPGVRVLAVVFLGIGSVFGGMQVSLTAFTEAIGRPGLNGLLYGTFAAGNMLAGLACGAIAWRGSPRRRLLTAYAVLALATSFLWAPGTPLPLAALGLLVGLCIAPAMITGYTLVESLVPASARTEAFTWLTGAVALGQATAVTASGRLADAFGASAGFTVPLAGTALALAVVVTLRGRLVPAHAGRTAPGGLHHRTPVAVD